MAHQRPGHGQHLLLAAGQSSGHLFTPLLQAGEIIEHHFQIRGVHRLFDERAHFQILLDGHLQEDAPPLRHVGQALGQKLAGIDVGDVLAAEADGARPGVHQAGDGFQDGTFARAVGTDQRHDLALVYLKGNALDGMDRAIVHMDVVDFQHAHWASSFPR